MSTIDNQTPIQFTTGLNLDDDVSIIKNGDYTYALNGMLNHKYGNQPFIGNYPSNSICSYLKDGFQILCAKLITDDRVVIFSCNPSTGESEIGELLNCVYTVKVNDPCLGFRTNKLIQCSFRRSYNCTEFLYWTDDNQPMRWMNYTTPPLKPDGSLDCERLNLFRVYQRACLKVEDVVDNGKLQTGVYFICMQYADENGNPLTPPTNLIGPVDIYEDSLSNSYEKITGNKIGIVTSKAIRVNVTNTDPYYSYYNLLVVQIIDGVKTAYKVGPISTTQESYVYTGINSGIEEIDLFDVLTRPVVYQKAKTVEAIDNVLAWGNLTGRNQLNFQQYANQIQVQWQVKRVKANSAEHTYKNPLSTIYKRGYMRDEVYPLGIVLVYADGTESMVYPLIGRELNRKSDGSTGFPSVDQYGNSLAGWDDSIISSSIKDNIEKVDQERWKVYNTATIEGSEAFDPSLDEYCAEYGEMAYWEAQDEIYPNKPEIWGTMAGKKVRHFKFPDSSIIHIHDGEAFQRTVKEQPQLAYMGLKFPNLHKVMDSLPDEIKKQIQGWRIVRGDRTFNKSINAKGLLYNTYMIPFTRLNEDDERFYSAWPYNDTRGTFVNETMGMYGYIGKDPDWVDGKISHQDGTGGVFAVVKNDVFTFHSPDTSFKKNSIRSYEMKVESLEYGKSKGQFRYIDWFPGVRVHKQNKDTDQVMVQYESEGWYNNYLRSDYQDIRFKLKDAVYAPSGELISTGNIGKPLHNRIREACVVLGTDRDVKRSSIIDDSTVWLGGAQQTNSAPGILKWIDKAVFGLAFNLTVFYLTGISSISEAIWNLFNANYEPYGEYCGVEEDLYRTISSYYVSLKNNVPNQYGSIYNIDWVDIGYCSNDFPTSCVFGGDTFISFFSLKRKHAFFLCAENQRGTSAGSEIQDLPGCQNIPGTRFGYYSRNKTIGWDVLGLPGACKLSDDREGLIPLYYYGVPCFWVESDINAELRYETDDESGLFFNCLHDGAVSVHTWLLRSIYEDNQYLYNFDYSMNNNLVPFDRIKPSYDPNNPCITDYFTRVIYSLESTASDTNDNWQVYKPLNYYDFPNTKGELWDMRYIGQNKTLFRFENTLYLFGGYNVLEGSDGPIRLGSGKLFSTPPVEFITTDVGYAGTTSQWAYNSTQYGSFFVDIKRGQVFLFNQKTGLQEISDSKMSSWFIENLPLQIIKDLPNFKNTDAPSSHVGVGLISTFDYLNDLWILTKKDYSVVNKDDIQHIIIDDNKIYYKGLETDFSNTDLFENKGWTISYSPISRRWISWYSFIQDYYFNTSKDYYSSAGNTIYKHNSNAFAVYNGINYPFIIEGVAQSEEVETLNSFQFLTRCFDYKGAAEYELQDYTFNYGIFYTGDQSTGLLSLNIQDENDLSKYFELPENQFNKRELKLRRSEHMFFVSDFYDVVKNRTNHISMFTADWNNLDYRSQFPIDKVVNNQAMDYNKSWKEAQLLRNNWVKFRLYFTNHNSFKLLSQFLISNTRKSY